MAKNTHCNRIIAVFTADNCLCRLAVEAIGNLSKGGGFLAGANQQLAFGMAKRTFRRDALSALGR